MKILVAVAVVLVLVLIIAGILAYRRRALANDHASAQWMVDVKSLPIKWNDNSRNDWAIDLVKVTPYGTVEQRSRYAYVIGADEDFDQKLASYKLDAEAKAFTLNGLDTN